MIPLNYFSKAIIIPSIIIISVINLSLKNDENDKLTLLVHVIYWLSGTI